MSTPKPKTAFGYARLSRDDERSTSIARQRADIERWCTSHDVELIETFDDVGLSAYKRDVRRPGFERLLARLGEADLVITWKLDRLARSVIGLAKLVETFEAAGVGLATIDGAVDTTTAQGRAMVQMASVFGELEAATTSERVKAWHVHLQEKGLHAGQVPYAHERDEDGRLVIVPEQLAAIEDAARRYVGGESLRAVARTAPMPGTASGRMTHPNLAKILRSDRMLEALPQALAGRLVVEMKERGRTGTSATPSLLGGVARCGVCDGTLTIVGSRGRGDARRWAAYSCRTKSHVSVSQPALDRIVSAAVLDVIDSGRLLKRAARRKPKPTTMEPAAIEARIEALEVARFEEGTIAHESYLKRRGALMDKLAKAHAIAERDAGPDIPLALAQQLPQTWPHLSVPERRQIVRALVREVRVAKATSHGPVDPDRAEITWR